MSKLEQLINKLCPEGVEYKALGELGDFYSGLSGKSKNDFSNGNAKFITYMNVFSNLSLKIDVDDKVKIGEKENQNTIQYGDVLFTGSSETPEECGMSSVLTSITDEKLYLNSFCFGFRFYDKNLMMPEFSKYVFRASEIRKQIKRTASGVTRFNVSKKKMEKVIIPLPPLPVQEEIVRILDKFTELIAELIAELTARKYQYEYYRNNLLSKNTNKKSLKQIALSSCSGGTPLKSNKAYYDDGTIPWLRTQEVVFNEINKTDCFITELAVQKTSAKWIPANCVIVAISGASAGRCAINKIPLTTNQHCLAIEINPEVALYKYVFYCVCNQYEDLIAKKEGARGDLNSSRILGLEIPIPYPEDKEKSLAEQQRIVDILDRFDRLCNDISEGLPAEIEARQKQYEYYRDKLLTFKKKDK
ncbi:restriction endonuclease subunit S [Clostridioides difficile]|uniref:restriction endonuclease subunit S n=1 Tax=Clostridioides difficile TaxID=1496 RepID=UPI00093C8375|nr:restriction endonuclease subunit S [Clostridioides difficile]OYO87563.1 restriction endonuclease subunit S [Clostridioides difficile]HCQ5598564.1 restriction endonuclease subunit S [Clostridioides difficile]HCQ6187119.1 restriction endonuclease subunit S [Clostridioides difficile]